ncbi:uncharacterized protein LOC118106285 isoform X4 [Hippoglossus stenolepis]|uniref:uncharacterized protein LOC118106285 isoform X4 n=1 Tax=Hippoglossus stenolepis TaxID=195615 RepID=UPI00159C1EF4|nr:uncharacterized protein LOC118106285 isoform X4 [Hippoglossus stenolepis]
MNADKWIFPLALCFICASSNDEQHFEKSCGQYPYLCERHIVSTPLGSSVLLPCNFTTNGLGWVSWVHASGENLLRLKADGHVQFMLPKEGRVKVFPNQGSRGNYPIRIDELQDSDLGCYRCLQGDKCHQVDLHVTTDTLSKETWGLIYICVGVVTFVLLGVCTYFLHKKMTQDSTNNIVCVHFEVNQEEISNQQTMSASLENHERGFRKKKAKANREYKNPIYNRSQEQLNL